MPRRDYYAVLGVTRSAAPRTSSARSGGWRRNTTPTRTRSTSTPRRASTRIVEAYECLSDPTERSRYDKIGPLYRPDGKPPTTDDINNLVQDAVQTLFRRDKADRRGEDLKFQLELRLEEVGSGSERTIEIERLAPCERCKGDGAEPQQAGTGGKKTCDACGGPGKSATRRLFRSDCPRCDGRGFTIVVRCTQCDGRAASEHRDGIKVKIPAGVATGQKLKVRGKGNVGERGGPPGYFLVLVHVADHALFQRRGADLICDVPLLLQEAALGTELVVPTSTGRRPHSAGHALGKGVPAEWSGAPEAQREAADGKRARRPPSSARPSRSPRASIQARRRRSSCSGAGSGRTRTRCARPSTRS